MSTEDVMSTETRSPTVIETEHVDMAQFLPIRDQTLQDVKQFTKMDESLRARQEIQCATEVTMLFLFLRRTVGTA